jgi:hypothetical protein
VLVGPSAGYCLDDSFLARFREVTVLEPDPFARWLLGRRLRDLGVRSVRWVEEDLVMNPLASSGPALDGLLEELPGASVLFANLLGQARFLLDDARFNLWQSQWSLRIAPALAHRPWASFHDRVSSDVAPLLRMPHHEAIRLDDPALVEAFYRGSRDAGARIELFDHLNGGLFPNDLPHTYFHWPIEPGAHHLIEAVHDPRRVALERR